MKDSNLTVHVGLPRTASTFLQERIFDQLRGIQYLGKTRPQYPVWDLDVETREKVCERLRGRCDAYFPLCASPEPAKESLTHDYEQV